FSNGLIVSADYGYAFANMETHLIDPGGEIIFGDYQFNRHSLRIAADYWFSHRDGLTLQASFSEFAYVDGGPFYDYSSRGAGIGWLHQMSPTVVFDATFFRTEFEAKDTLAYRDSTSDQLTFGVRGQLNAVLSSELRAGYRVTRFKTNPSEPEVPDYEGVVVSGALTWELGHHSSLRLGLVRWDFPSAYGTNAYYDSAGGSLTYSLSRGRLSGQALARYNRNAYDQPDPKTGELRTDDIWGLGVGVGLQLGRRFTLRGSYLHERRYSLEAFSYTVNTLSLGLVVGY
ncbi:MAG: outer membrane beta-barrel protein, partial [bacterium]|nr:outer membrane beta-barrel protein [bacterium]